MWRLIEMIKTGKLNVNNFAFDNNNNNNKFPIDRILIILLILCSVSNKLSADESNKSDEENVPAKSESLQSGKNELANSEQTTSVDKAVKEKVSVKSEKEGFETEKFFQDDSMDNVSADDDKEKNISQPDKIKTSVGLISRLAGGRDFAYQNATARSTDTFSVGFSSGITAELLFLKLTEKLWLGLSMEVNIQFGLNSTTNLVSKVNVDNFAVGESYGHITYLWSIIPIGGLVISYYLNPKFRFSFSALGGYDRTYLQVRYDDPTKFDEPGNSAKTKAKKIQPGGGFVVGGKLFFDYAIPASSNFSFILGADIIWTFGLTDVLKHSLLPSGGLRVGAMF